MELKYLKIVKHAKRLNMITMDDNKLVLGTAQLGLNYGIANKTGKPDLATRAILFVGMGGRYSYFDTAQAYGESEWYWESCRIWESEEAYHYQTVSRY